MVKKTFVHFLFILSRQMLLYRVHAGHFYTFEPYYLYSGFSDW